MSRVIQSNKRYIPYVTWVIRILVGATFIVSGLSKMIDVWGFTYKIEQYLNVWGWDVIRQLVVILAMTISAFEFVVGLTLAVGCYKRVSVWLSMAIMIFMLPLSTYIMFANPVDDCGCFGDFLKISNVATFFKNVAIVIFLVYLLKFNNQTKGLFHEHFQWIVAGLAYVYVMTIGFWGYNVQPLIDFRNYKEGHSILSDWDVEENCRYEFEYERDGVKKCFAVDSLPDSTWTFVDRIAIKEDNERLQENATDIIISNIDGEDVTSTVLSQSGKQILLLIPELNYADISYSYLINEMYDYVVGQGGDMIGIFAIKDKEQIGRWMDISLAKWPMFIAEDTAIKEIARGKISVVYVNDGIIQWKRTLSSIPTDIFSEKEKEGKLEVLYPEGEKQFRNISIAFLLSLVTLWLINTLIFVVKFIFSRKNKKKNVTLQIENKKQNN